MTDDDDAQERQINIHFSPEIMAGVYANFANVSHSDYEFTITFARVDHEVDEEEIPGVVVSRVNYTRFSKAESFDFDEALDKIIASAAKFNVDRVKQEDVAKAGGGPPDEE